LLKAAYITKLFIFLYIGTDGLGMDQWKTSKAR
jgi:hypothetical protein